MTTGLEDRVLVVEDDLAVRESLALLLQSDGLTVGVAEDGPTAVAAFLDGDFDAVVLDLMLPGLDGFEVCRRLRAVSTVPIVMVTARDETADIVQGLELGADDYVTKPFDPAELLARVHAALRRRDPGDSGDGDGVLTFGPLAIDIRAAQVTLDGDPVDLSATELRLLVELARRPGEAMSRPTLLQLVWGYDYLGDSRLVDMAILRLREKLGDDAGHPRFVATVRGIGYRFEATPP